jgi:hypothetical protein
MNSARAPDCHYIFFIWSLLFYVFDVICYHQGNNIIYLYVLYVSFAINADQHA